jgi:uncharacterized membrane protein YsdA (DUF1294 family)
MTPFETPWLLTGYAILINIAGFLIFAWDKRCAQKGMWRISENNLLALAIIGGTVGVIAAQRILRHKTRKEPFRTILLWIVVAQMIWLLERFPNIRNRNRGFLVFVFCDSLGMST